MYSNNSWILVLNVVKEVIGQVSPLKKYNSQRICRKKSPYTANPQESSNLTDSTQFYTLSGESTFKWTLKRRRCDILNHTARNRVYKA